MATVNDIQALTDWLNEKVCPLLYLKEYSDNSTTEYNLVHPRAIPVYMPSRQRDTETNTIPCIIVSLMDASDYPKLKSRRYTIQLTVIVYNPGTAPQDYLIPTGDGSYNTGDTGELAQNKEGWQDVLNSIDIIKHELAKTDFITPELRLTSSDGINYSLTDPSDASAKDYPLFSGYINFTCTAGYTPADNYSDYL